MLYLDVTDVAKLIRKELKKYFPGIKFSVKSKRFSMGTSIDIEWADGPNVKQVDGIVKQYQYFSHTDVTDLAYYKDYSIHPETGEKFESGAKYIHASRSVSNEIKLQVAESVCKKYGFDMPSYETYGESIHFQRDYVDNWAPSSVISRAIGEWTAFPEETEEETEPVAEIETIETEEETNAPQVTHEGDWTWVKFNEKPSQEVIDNLKSLGFRWSRKRSAWYATEIIEFEKEEQPEEEQQPESTTPPYQVTEITLDGECCGHMGTFNNWVDADTCLREHAQHAPKNGAYTKVRFSCTFEDGSVYNGRYDLKYHDMDFQVLLGYHINTNLEYMAGKAKPDHLTEDEYQYHLNSVVSKFDPDRKESAIEWLENYDIPFYGENVIEVGEDEAQLIMGFFAKVLENI